MKMNNLRSRLRSFDRLSGYLIGCNWQCIRHCWCVYTASNGTGDNDFVHFLAIEGISKFDNLIVKNRYRAGKAG